MSKTGGFGLVISISASAVATAVQLTFSKRIDLAGFTQTVTIAGAQVSVDVALGEPEVRLFAAEPKSATLLFPYAGTVVEAGSSREVFVELTIKVPLIASSIGVLAQLSAAHVVSTKLTFGTVSPSLKAWLESETVRANAEARVRATSDLEVSLPLGSMNFPMAPLAPADLRVVDEAILVAARVVGLPGGDINGLTPFHGSADMAIAQSQLAVNFGFAINGPPLLQAQVGSAGTVKSVSAILLADCMALTFVLDDTTVRATVAIDLSSTCMKLNILSVDVQPPWWVWFLVVGAFLFVPEVPITLLVFSGLAPLLAALIPMAMQILNQRINAQFARRFEFEVAPNAKAVVFISSVEITPTDLVIYSRISAEADGAKSQLSCPVAVAPGRSIAATLGLRPGLVNPNDRSASLLWTVQNLTTNTKVLEQDRSIGTPGWQRLDLTNNFPANTRLRVEAALVKWNSSAQQGQARLVRSQDLRIVDRLDTSKPFVQWSHFVQYPARQRVGGSGPNDRVLVGVKKEWRNSKIHKTAFSARCADADRFSHRPGVQLSYLTSLPAESERLCKSCFP